MDHIPLFRLFYSSTYTILYLITLGFLAITPISLLWTTLEAPAIQFTVMIGGAYILTASAALLIYSARLYTNRLVLAAVGNPLRPAAMPRPVRNLVATQLQRCARVACESRPRDLAADDPSAPSAPPWGPITHRGWSPSSLRFAPVITELPHLIEAHAVSLAPPTPDSTPPVPDPLVVAALRRPRTSGLRDYLAHLTRLGLLPSSPALHFLKLYERARFARPPPSEPEFHALMATFAALLAEMSGPDTELLHDIRDADPPTTTTTTTSRSPSPDRDDSTPFHSPVTARSSTPLPLPRSPSLDSFRSV